MKPIRRKILNKRVNVFKSGQSISPTGAATGVGETLYENLPMRIVKAKGDDKIKEQGATAQSSYIGLIGCILDNGTLIIIKTGYIIVEGSDKYKVDFVDDEPGGLAGHHQEIYMSILGK